MPFSLEICKVGDKLTGPISIGKDTTAWDDVEDEDEDGEEINIPLYRSSRLKTRKNTNQYATSGLGFKQINSFSVEYLEVNTQKGPSKLLLSWLG